ncbi:MAG: ABC transporter ATP-binding protein [Candidatus Nanopelagicales bacterium]
MAVEVEGLVKRFGATVALDGLDLSVRRGEFITLVGASGCGKSTLLNILAGLDRPTAGSVEVRAERVALMFQDATLLPWLTAGQNVELALKLRGVAKSDRRDRVHELLATVRLDGKSDTRPHELSGGMRQRVALARMLAQEAEVVLMDEPFGALDAMTRDHMHDELERIWSSHGLTVLFVTHNVREAVRLGDRAILLASSPGRVKAAHDVGLPRPRRIDSPEVSALASQLTSELREEVLRHVS